MKLSRLNKLVFLPLIALLPIVFIKPAIASQACQDGYGRWHAHGSVYMGWTCDDGAWRFEVAIPIGGNGDDDDSNELSKAQAAFNFFNQSLNSISFELIIESVELHPDHPNILVIHLKEYWPKLVQPLKQLTAHSLITLWDSTWKLHGLKSQPMLLLIDSTGREVAFGDVDSIVVEE